MRIFSVSQDESEYIGWVTISDVFFLMSMICLYQYAATAYQLDQANIKIAEKEKQLMLLQNQHKDLNLALQEKDMQLEKLQLLSINLNNLLKNKQQEIITIQKQFEQLEALKIPNQGRTEKEIRQELIGLKGNLAHVAIVLDRSGSMSTRWSQTCEIIQAWLKYLPVEKCSLIAFSNSTNAYNSSPVDMLGVEGEENRNKMLQWLKKINPDGGTNMYEALEKAYEHQPDTIILFTDGQPNGPNKDKIVPLCQDKKKTVNTIAVGSYYDDPAFTTLLITIASVTDGSFRGR